MKAAYFRISLSLQLGQISQMTITSSQTKSTHDRPKSCRGILIHIYEFNKHVIIIKKCVFPFPLNWNLS